MAETSTKPYLIRAIYEWCNDNGYTPYLAVEVDERAMVPREYVKDGEIVLNVSPLATQNLVIGNELIVFHARFGGVSRELSIPIDTVAAVYARESGHGMAFDVVKSSAEAVDEEATAPASPAPVAGGRSARAAKKPVVVPSSGAGQGVEGAGRSESASDLPGDGAPRSGRSHLTRVK
jgi:stringent starvation protein B